MKNKILAFILAATMPIWFIPAFLIVFIGGTFVDAYKDILWKLEKWENK